MMMRWVLIIGIGAVAALPWACGGKAVIDEGAGGATADNASSSTGGTGPGNQTSSVFVSTAAGPPPPACALASESPECNACASSCPTELADCCAATGCIDLVRCMADFCRGAQDQTACATMACPNEIAAGAASIAEAQALSACLIDCGCN